jgi:FkbM family methyltransferase
MNELKIPPDNFFTTYSKHDTIHNFGKESRDIALQYVTDFDRVIDIGAHVGISVLHWASLFKIVEAYEPMKDHYDYLIENTNHLTNVNLYNFAISNEHTTLKGAYRSTKNSGSFQLLDTDYTQPSKKAPRQLFDILSYRLDDFQFENINLIKIDVEGWEFEVLQGAVNTIAKHRPVLLVEFTGGSSKKSLHRYDVDEYYKLIESMNYKAVAESGDDTIYIPT